MEQNTLAMAAPLKLMGVGFEPLEEILTDQFMRQGGKVVTENLDIARAGYDYPAEHFRSKATAGPRIEWPYSTRHNKTFFQKLARRPPSAKILCRRATVAVGTV